jgi:hypothetical protein
MKLLFALSMLAIGLCGAHQAGAQTLHPALEASPKLEPSWRGTELFNAEKFVELDGLIQELAKSKARSMGGRFELDMLTSALHDWLGSMTEREDADTAEKFRAWREQVPKSRAEPIVEAMYLDAKAWRARGHGFSSSVASEGWRLFRERSELAWQLLMENKTRSSVIPTWYELALSVGQNVEIPDSQLSALFKQGTRRFPGYFAIYFAYARQFSPRWGGSYQSADAFIEEQVAARTNTEGEMLYTRLYWQIDQDSGAPEDFFESSLVSWPRMRAGFELMMKLYPQSKKNPAAFAIFACRARDAVTYFKLRPQIDPAEARNVGNGSYSLEVCDARFMQAT